MNINAMIKVNKMPSRFVKGGDEVFNDPVLKKQSINQSIRMVKS